MICQTCDGFGYAFGKRCWACEGEGVELDWPRGRHRVNAASQELGVGLDAQGDSCDVDDDGSELPTLADLDEF